VATSAEISGKRLADVGSGRKPVPVKERLTVMTIPLMQ
jgi:hypothetical protein